jgi:hypothetical protein
MNGLAVNEYVAVLLLVAAGAGGDLSEEQVDGLTELHSDLLASLGMPPTLPESFASLLEDVAGMSDDEFDEHVDQALNALPRELPEDKLRPVFDALKTAAGGAKDADTADFLAIIRGFWFGEE